MKRKISSAEKVTFTDRLAVAFLSGTLSLVTGIIIWFLIIAAFSFEGTYIFSSFKIVIGFTIIMAAFGFFMLENFIANLFGHIWHGIYNHLRH